MKNNTICSQCKTHMRHQWIILHLKQGISIPKLAKLSGYHQDTLYIWKRKYLNQGLAGLKDKSRAPHSHPNEYPDRVKELIRKIRQQAKNKEHRYLGPKIIAQRLKKQYGIKASPSGIGKFLHNDGLISKKRKRRLPKKQRVKKCKIHEPGQLIQADVKYSFKSYAGYWYYQYSSMDYLTNIAFAQIYEVQSNLAGILFTNSLVGFYPFKIQGLQTDNHATFTNRYTGYVKSKDPLNPRLHPFDINCLRLNITHYLIDKGKPAQNGKVERFHRSCEEEFYQHTTFKDLNSARKKLRDYLYYYNNEREHLGIKGLTPLEKLKTFPGYEKIKKLIP